MAKSELGVRPLHDRILVRRMAEEEKTAGGLFIPDTAKEKPQKGEIMATGKGRVTEDGKILPLEDFTDYYWYLAYEPDNCLMGRVCYQEADPGPLKKGHLLYPGSIFDFTDDYVEVFPGEEYTMLQIVTEQGEELLYIFANDHQIIGHED